MTVAEAQLLMCFGLKIKPNLLLPLKLLMSVKVFFSADAAGVRPFTIKRDNAFNSVLF